MSYDIIILKPVGSRTDNLADVGEVLGHHGSRPKQSESDIPCLIPSA